MIERKDIEPLTQRQQVLILNSFKRVFSKNDSNYLTQQAYKFISLAYGFIAHYNLGGFRCEYEDVNSLKRNILRNKEMNQWSNFRPGEENYDYYMSKKELYNKICDLIES